MAAIYRVKVNPRPGCRLEKHCAFPQPELFLHVVVEKKFDLNKSDNLAGEVSAVSDHVEWSSSVTHSPKLKYR